MKKLYKSWWVHNLIAHPLMQIIGLCNVRVAKKIHDSTLPIKLDGQKKEPVVSVKNSQIRQAMINDYGLKLSSNQEYLQGGECPDCHKKELWAYNQKPLFIQCSRLNSCGFSATAKELFPDLFTEET